LVARNRAVAAIFYSTIQKSASLKFTGLRYTLYLE
jgi:hypothetical protein